ncbi:protein HEG homolog 1 [Rhinatrema bivittatum]|uniref:protein HEG homolog 1 n=1 Tax=Rhinatrema bivittatum TaxID=194408 RepID=UPI00112652DA|nr:protein HEG homolog 1 [Rhinatrema bivittatum]
MYISTTFARGEDRTLLSIMNISMLESVTSDNISSFSESTQTFAVVRTGGRNISKSDIDIAVSSADPLITRSSKVLTYSSSKNDSSSDFSESTSSLFHKISGPTANTTNSFTTLNSIGNSESSSLDALQSSSQSSLSSSSSSDSSVPFNSSELFSSSPSESSSLLPWSPSSSELSSSSSWLPSSLPSLSSTSELPVSSSSSMLPFPSSLVPPSFSELPLSSSTPSSLSPFSSTSLSLSPLLPLFSSATSLSPSLSVQPVDSFQTNGSLVTSELPEQTVTMESSTALFYSGSTAGDMTHRDPDKTRDNTSVESTVLSFFRPGPTELLDSSSSDLPFSNITEGTVMETLTPRNDNFVKTTSFLSTMETSFSQRTQDPLTVEKSTSTILHATTLIDLITTDGGTIKGTTHSTHRTSRPVSLGTTTDYSTVFKTTGGQVDSTTKISYVTGISTPDVEINTATSTKVTDQNVPDTTTEIFSTVSTVSTKAAVVAQSSGTGTPMTSSLTTVPACSPNPCLHQGACVVDPISGAYQCECAPSWQGKHCSTDVDECLSNPCPAQATCMNTQGSFTCRCPLGYQLKKGAECSLVRTFMGQVTMSRDLLNATSGKYSGLRQIEGGIIQMLNASLLMLDGYYRSAVTETKEAKYIIVSVQNLFSTESNVTTYDVINSVKSFIKACKVATHSSESCQFMKQVQFFYQAGSLCSLRYPECDSETSECGDAHGVAQCQCKPGYFKYSKLDRSCRACEDGYKRENGTCVKCPFGFGGFNCRNPYQLITVVIAAAGGGLLLILGTALAVTCCRKSKNDISKLIFKSGEFQMSPYSEYPKNPCSSEWGREAIEMQENGSTKNLLQVTDVYYSPALRNLEVDRNGLYPYAGLPGSRHSCIYPGQYNPSFISDESRRRDYF